ncbi:MAG: maltose acetyltransferase domain-containing protein [Eubacteriales bacterium]|nr:maltose acetyltransferase domain-containing protein [Eubacteriales bacterium]
MTIKERMAACQLFTDDDAHYPEEAEALARARQRGKTLCWEINRLSPNDTQTRTELLKQLFGKMGENVWLEPPIYTAYGSNVTVGSNVYFNFNTTLVDDYTITIGSNVMFAPNVSIAVTNHPLHPVLRQRGEMYARPVVIEDWVWLGTGCIICPGVTVGEGAVIGAGSVVTRDVPPYTFAAGNPCRVIRELTERDKEYYFRDMRADQVEW